MGVGMSTVCKLGPKVRMQRSERKAAQHEFASRAFTTDKGGVPTVLAIACRAAVQALEKLRCDPRRTGAQKQRVYEQICREVKANETASEAVAA